MDSAAVGLKYMADVGVVVKSLEIGRFTGNMAMKLVNSVPSNGELRALATPPFNPAGTGKHVSIYA
ncbi:MAG: hypothetical protein H7843_00850 [Nitrospirota bacterium]